MVPAHLWTIISSLWRLGEVKGGLRVWKEAGLDGVTGQGKQVWGLIDFLSWWMEICLKKLRKVPEGGAGWEAQGRVVSVARTL